MDVEMQAGPRRATRETMRSSGSAQGLSVAVRQHLGHRLAAAYTQIDPAKDITDRFAPVLVELENALARSSARREADFRGEIVAAMPALRGFALSLVHNATDVDDLIQETLLRAWRNRTSFAPGTNFLAWIFTILRNQFYTEYRRRIREIQDEDGARAARLSTAPDQIDHLDLCDVQAALGRLPAGMREALILVTVSDISYDEAAAILDCKLGTVKSRVSRARERLAEALGYTGTEIGQDAVTLSACVVR